jgi:hypothetical protein
MQGDTRELFFLPKEILFVEAHGYNTRFSNRNKKKQLRVPLGIIVFVIFRVDHAITWDATVLAMLTETNNGSSALSPAPIPFISLFMR